MSLSSDLDRSSLPPRLPAWASYGLSLALVGLATGVAVVVDRVAAIPNLSLIFVLPVVVSAVSFGWGPALAAAAGGVVAFNFFLIAPRYSLHVADPANLWALVLLLAIAAIVSAVAAKSRQRAIWALQAADRALALQALARNLVAATERTVIATSVAETLTRIFKAPAVVVLEADGVLAPYPSPIGEHLSPIEMEAARWALGSRLPTRGGAYPYEAAAYDFWPVQTPQRQLAAIGVRLAGRDEGRPASPEDLVEAVGGYLSVALDREHYAAQALERRIEKASERLKADLLAAVSHDLKTPLSTILVTLQSLRRFAEVHDADTRAELLDLAEAEAGRLTGLVGNLLDMSRLDAGAVVPLTSAAAPSVLVAKALDRATAALAGHPVANEVHRDSPPLNVDAALFESALANVLENAGKYTPAGGAVRILSGADDGVGWIEVQDEGPGFPDDVEPLFEKFARGVEGDGRPPGTGLGLAIARGFLEAQGGKVEAFNREDRAGARVRLSAPLAPVAPLTSVRQTA